MLNHSDSNRLLLWGLIADKGRLAEFKSRDEGVFVVFYFWPAGLSQD